jgi:HemY protein
MLRLILLLILATALALAAVWFVENPGRVLLEWQGYRLETSVGILILAALAATALLFLLFELIRVLLRAPTRWRRNRSRRRESRGYHELSSGMIAAAAGDPQSARLHARQAERLLDNEPAVLLLNAQAAQLDGDDDAAQLNYRAMLKEPGTEFLALRGLLAQALKAGDREEALELARRAYRRHPETTWTITTLFDLLTERQRWAEALPLVDGLERQKLIDEYTARRHRAALNLLVGRARLAENDANGARQAARKAFRIMPTFAPAAVLVSRSAVELGQAAEARRTLERAWEVRPHPDLARAYADLVPEENAKDRLRRFDRLRRRHPIHVETQLTMAELAMAVGDHALARSYLDKVMAREPTARACRLMAEVEKASGAASSAVEQWRNRAVEAKRDPAWVCEDTGDMLPAWQPFSRSGRFNLVDWTTPPALTPLLEADRPSTFVLTHGARADDPPHKPIPRERAMTPTPG